VGKEVAVARPVVEYLREQDWEVYQEVECISGVADIVAVRGKLVGVK
jgi:hypothetical protein